MKNRAESSPGPEECSPNERAVYMLIATQPQWTRAVRPLSTCGQCNIPASRWSALGSEVPEIIAMLGVRASIATHNGNCDQYLCRPAQRQQLRALANRQVLFRPLRSRSPWAWNEISQLEERGHGVRLRASAGRCHSLMLNRFSGRGTRREIH